MRPVEVVVVKSVFCNGAHFGQRVEYITIQYALAQDGVYQLRHAAIKTREAFASLYFSRRCFFSFTLAHSSASGGPSFFSMIGFQTLASSAFNAVYSCWLSGTSSSA